jgi:hypothetical protein
MLRWGSALLVAALFCGVASAQVLYGSLTGIVTDPSGASVPGAKVELINVGTALPRNTVTDDRGVYRFTDLQFGTYKITVKAASFATVVEDNVPISNNEVRRVNFSLTISKTTEVIEVKAEQVALQTDKGDVERVVSSQEITNIPENGREGRNFQGLLYLLPGAGIPAAREANSEAGNPSGAQTLWMNGQSNQGNSTKLDGTVIAYPWLPVNIAYVPPTDAIQVVNIVTNAFDAEQGSAGGAAVNVSIKSGTNQLHGGLFEYNQSNIEAARNTFSEGTPIGKNVFNQYGLFVGGPVYIPKLIHGKNKLFWFMDWQGTKRNQYSSSTNTLTLPQAPWRTGDFSTATCPAAGGAGCIYDPMTGNVNGTNRLPFKNNVIPAARINSASATLAGVLPALTRPNQTNLNYDAFADTYSHRNNYDTKINYNPNDKLGIWARYSALPMDIYTPLVLGPIAGGDAFGGGNPGHAGGKVQTTGIGFNYILSNSLLLDGNFGWTRQHIGADGDEFNGDYGSNVLKIPGTNGPGVDYQGVPGFQVAGFANIGNTNTGSPFLFRDMSYTTAYNLSKVHGAHNMRFGFQYDHYALNHFQPQGGTFGTARGTFGFDGLLTDLCANSTSTTACSPASGQTGFYTLPSVGSPNTWAAFLLGFPSQMGKVTQFTDPNSLRFSDYGMYARDQWQVNAKLTISYGLRWEYYPIYAHDQYGANRYDPTTNTILIGCEGGTPCDTGADATKKDFAPRFGFAYRLNTKTVVRGGYGITIDPDNFRNQRNQFPSVVNLNFTPANSGQFITSAGVVPPAGSLGGSSLSTGLPPPTYYTITQGVFTSACTNTANPCATAAASTTNFLPSLSTGTFQQNQDRGYIQTWNLFIQHEFSSSMTGEVGYVGAHGLRLMMQANINGSLPNTGNNGRLLAPYNINDMNSYYPFGGTKYDALQSQLKKRFGNSIITMAYTYSHAQDNINGDNGDGTLWRTWPYSTAQAWGTSGFNRGQTFTLSSVYTLPFGPGQKYLSHGIAGQIIGGWELSGTFERFSGLPFTVSSGVSCNCGGQSQSANQVNPTVAIYGGHDAQHPYFDGTAFTAPATGTLGNTQRDILTGPGFVNVDARISRSFALLKEGKLKFQIFGDGFNSFNHPNYANPSSSVNTATPASATNPYNSYSVITALCSSCAPRQLQVGARFTF